MPNQPISSYAGAAPAGQVPTYGGDGIFTGYAAAPSSGSTTIPPTQKPPVTPTPTPPPVTPATPTPPPTPTSPASTGTPTQGTGNNDPSKVGNYGTSAQSSPAPFGVDGNGVPYGGQNSNNPNPNSSVYGNGGTAVTGKNANGLTPDQQNYENTVNGFSDKVNGILNGTIPLSAGEQAQIQGLENQFTQLINQQQSVNANDQGTAQIRGYETGTAEFDRGFQANTISQIVSAGATKISNLQTQEASAVASLTESLQNNDITQIKAAYDLYTSAHADVSKSISDTVASTQQAMKDAAIANVISSGTTDPAGILKALQANGNTNITASDITDAIKNLSPDAADIYSVATTATEDGANPDTVKLIMAAPDKETALNILAQSGVANSAVSTMMSKYPDAGIVPGDTVEQANAKVQASPTYTMAQKSAALDLVQKQANIQKTFADIAAETVSPEDATAFLNDLPDYNGTQYITPTQLSGLSTKEKSTYTNAAQQAGIPIIAQKDADALSTISAAQSDLQSFQSFITSNTTLPTNWLDQPGQYADVTLNKYLQTNNALSAFNTWEASAVPLLAGLKGAGSGGGGASRLLSTASEWLPTDTDTLATAKLKISHLMTLLNNGANSIVPPKNTSTYSGVNLPPDPNNPAPQGSTYGGVTLPN